MSTEPRRIIGEIGAELAPRVAHEPGFLNTEAPFSQLTYREATEIQRHLTPSMAYAVALPTKELSNEDPPEIELKFTIEGVKGELKERSVSPWHDAESSMKTNVGISSGKLLNGRTGIIGEDIIDSQSQPPLVTANSARAKIRELVATQRPLNLRRTKLIEGFYGIAVRDGRDAYVFEDGVNAMALALAETVIPEGSGGENKWGSALKRLSEGNYAKEVIDASLGLVANPRRHELFRDYLRSNDISNKYPAIRTISTDLDRLPFKYTTVGIFTNTARDFGAGLYSMFYSVIAEDPAILAKMQEVLTVELPEKEGIQKSELESLSSALGSVSAQDLRNGFAEGLIRARWLYLEGKDISTAPATGSNLKVPVEFVRFSQKIKDLLIPPKEGQETSGELDEDDVVKAVFLSMVGHNPWFDKDLEEKPQIDINIPPEEVADICSGVDAALLSIVWASQNSPRLDDALKRGRFALVKHAGEAINVAGDLGYREFLKRFHAELGVFISGATFETFEPVISQFPDFDPRNVSDGVQNFLKRVRYGFAIVAAAIDKTD